MKNRKILFGIIGVIAVVAITVVFIIDCYRVKPLKNAHNHYHTATEAVDLQNIEYQITVNKEITIGDELYNEKSSKIVKIAQSSAYTEETFNINNETGTITEWYNNEYLYSKVNNSYIVSTMLPEIFAQRYIPFIIIDSTQYQNISGIKEKDHMTVYFKEPTKPEKWISASIDTLESASGTAIINNDKTLRSLTYEAAYKTGTQNIKLTVVTEYITSNTDISPVHDVNKFISQPTPDAAMTLEKACSLLLASHSINAHYSEEIQCEAFGDTETTDIYITTKNNNGWSSTIKTESTLSNAGKVGSDNTIRKDETFVDGIYKISINGSDPISYEDVSENEIKTICRDTIISTIILPEHIKSYEVCEDNNAITYTFNANADLTTQIQQDALIKLYGDSNILTVEAENYQTLESICYLTIDKVTNIPISSGFRYEGTYTINGLPYKLLHTADQEYKIID